MIYRETYARYLKTCLSSIVVCIVVLFICLMIWTSLVINIYELMNTYCVFLLFQCLWDKLFVNSYHVNRKSGQNMKTAWSYL